VVICTGVRAVIKVQSVLEVCGRYVATMQYDSEQKLYKNVSSSNGGFGVSFLGSERLCPDVLNECSTITFQG
jgi:hypothetical protein